jgi:hypothetical protein
MEADALIIRAAHPKDLDREMSIAGSKKVKLDPRGRVEKERRRTKPLNSETEPTKKSRLVPILQLQGNKKRRVSLWL